MEKFKVSSIEDEKPFLITDCYKKLCEIFKTLKFHKGKIVHVLGAPGTGKSANIYNALGDADLNVYDIKFDVKNINSSSKEIFNALFESITNDLKIKTKKDVYKKLSEYDAILIADSFHDVHVFDPKRVGFSQWTDKVGFKALYFYLLCIQEYFKYRKEFKKINIVFQTAWRIRIRGKKYDIFTDFGLFSKILVKTLKLSFIVVEISYSEEETIQIVKMHIKDVDEENIKQCIQKYGYKPRFICNALKK
ncbi:MAG: hypothetical protein ACPK7O_06110 [Methanobacterium sp.]